MLSSLPRSASWSAEWRVGVRRWRQVDGRRAAAGGLDLGPPFPVVRCTQAGGDPRVEDVESVFTEPGARGECHIGRGDGHRVPEVASTPRSPCDIRATRGGKHGVVAVNNGQPPGTGMIAQKEPDLRK